MTREEAIAIIENEKKCVNRANKNDYCNRDCYNCELVKTDTEILTALDMAIKALEQEPCDDSISRQAVLSMQYRIDDSATLSTRDVVNVDDIEDLPPVAPKPKKGHWIKTNNYFPGDYENIDYIKCSCCNVESLEEGDYCPNCGAEMVEPKEWRNK